jgi:hypothetical protein
MRWTFLPMGNRRARWRANSNLTWSCWISICPGLTEFPSCDSYARRSPACRSWCSRGGAGWKTGCSAWIWVPTITWVSPSRHTKAQPNECSQNTVGSMADVSHGNSVRAEQESAISRIRISICAFLPLLRSIEQRNQAMHFIQIRFRFEGKPGPIESFQSRTLFQKNCEPGLLQKIHLPLFVVAVD